MHRAVKATRLLSTMFHVTTENYQREISDSRLWDSLLSIDMAEPFKREPVSFHTMCKSDGWDEYGQLDKMTMLNTEASWLRPIFNQHLEDVCKILNDTELNDTHDIAMKFGLWQCFDAIDAKSKPRKQDHVAVEKQKTAHKRHEVALPGDRGYTRYCQQGLCKTQPGKWTDSSNSRELDAIFKDGNGEWRRLPQPLAVEYIQKRSSVDKDMYGDEVFGGNVQDLETIFLQDYSRGKKVSITPAFVKRVPTKGASAMQKAWLSKSASGCIFELHSVPDTDWTVNTNGEITGSFNMPGKYLMILKAYGDDWQQITFTIKNVSRVKVISGPPKDAERALQKANKKYDGKLNKARDLLRSTMEFESVLMMLLTHVLFDQCKELTGTGTMETEQGWLFDSCQMVRSKNLFKTMQGQGQGQAKRAAVAQMANDDIYEDCYEALREVQEVHDDYSTMYTGNIDVVAGRSDADRVDAAYEMLSAPASTGQDRSADGDVGDVAEFQPPRLHTNVNFKGHVCEIQMLLRKHVQVKDMLHPYYQILRGFKAYTDYRTDKENPKFRIPHSMVQSVFVLSDADLESEYYAGYRTFVDLNDFLKGKWNALVKEGTSDVKLRAKTRAVLKDDLVGGDTTEDAPASQSEMDLEYFITGCDGEEDFFNGKYVRGKAPGTSRVQYRHVIDELHNRKRVRTIEYYPRNPSGPRWRLVDGRSGFSFYSKSSRGVPPTSGWKREDAQSSIPTLVTLPQRQPSNGTGEDWREAAEWLHSACLLPQSGFNTWKVTDFAAHLENGVTLCKLANCLQDNAVERINLSPRSEVDKIQNLRGFLEFAPFVLVTGYDVPDDTDFVLSNGKFSKVVRCLLMLADTFPRLNQDDAAEPPPRAPPATPLPPADELLLSERRYVRMLELLCSHYMDGMASNTKVLSKTDHKILFANAKGLLNLHKSFLANLIACMKTPAADRTISTAFNELIKKMRLYKDYCSNWPHAVAALKQIFKSKSGRATLAQLEQELDEQEPATLDAVAAAPLEQLHFYGKCIERIVVVDSSHRDHLALKDAYENYVAMVVHIKRRSFTNLKEKLDGYRGGVSLQQFSPLIFDSELICKDMRSAKSKFTTRYVFLLQQQIFVTEATKSKFKFKALYDVEADMKVVDLNFASLPEDLQQHVDMSPNKPAFALTTGRGLGLAQRYIFAASTQVIKNHWMDELRKMIAAMPDNGAAEADEEDMYGFLPGAALSSLGKTSVRTQVVGKCRGRWDFSARMPDELNFVKGEEIAILEKQVKGLNGKWWKGSLRNGTVGVFPANYVREINVVEGIYT